MNRFLTFFRLLPVVVCLFLCSCGSQVPTNGGAAQARFAQAPTDRRGLGTKWGENRNSRVEFTSFRRADPTRPIATAAIYYNDDQGIRAMVNTIAWQRTWPMLPPRMQSMISIGLKDPVGRFYPGVFIGDSWFVVGQEGRRYVIVVRNKTDLRLEVVLSVDGLDVLDGRKASVRKPGYIMASLSELKVDGFRQSTESVAAFRFSPVRESYTAEKYHNTQNVGVIGVAVFNEAGTNPLTEREVQKRLNANPFPGRFAAPPQN
jgi:hypothetical protein